MSDEIICTNPKSDGGICGADLLKIGVIVKVMATLQATVEIVDGASRIAVEKWPHITPMERFNYHHIYCPKCRRSLSGKFPDTTVYTSSANKGVILEEDEEFLHLDLSRK